MKRKLVKLKNNQRIQEKDGEIIISKSYYEVVPSTEAVQVFTGHTLPIPYSLAIYLKGNELKVFMVVLEKLRETGHCFLSVNELGKLIGTTGISAYTALLRLRKIGIAYVRRYGTILDKQIDFKVVQKIEDLCQKYGILSIPEFRKELGLISPLDVSERMISNVKNRITEKVIDPIEDEEYV